MTTNKPPIHDDEIELLNALANYEGPQEWMTKRFGLTLDAIRSAFRRFQEYDLIEPASLEAAVSSLYTVRELQELLSTRQLPTKGSKQILVDRLIAELSDRDRSDIASRTRHKLQLTEQGQSIYFAHREKLKRLQAENESTLYLMLCDREVKSAVAFFNQNWGRWFRSDSGGNPDEELCSFLRRVLDNPLRDLKATQTERDAVRASLAVSFLVNENVANASRRLIRNVGQMPPCPEAAEWWRTHLLDEDEDDAPLSTADSEPDSETIAYLYCSRRLAELRCGLELDACFAARDNSKGIEIFKHPMAPEDAPCRTGPLKFNWKSISDLPRLPCCWECLCHYSNYV